MDESKRLRSPLPLSESDAVESSSHKPASISLGFALFRIALAVIFASVAALLVVEGVLLHQVGFGQSLVGRVSGVGRGPETSTLSFDYVTMDGRDFTNQCQVPTEFIDSLVPGRAIEVFHRIGLRGTYACVREGLHTLHSEGTKSIYWGVAFAVLSLAMIIWLLGDLWRYTRFLETRRLADNSAQ